MLTGEIENVTNATVTSLSVVPAIPPPPPEVPVIPPQYENATDEDGDPVVTPVDDIVTPSPPIDTDGQDSIKFVIPDDMRVTEEPEGIVSKIVFLCICMYPTKLGYFSSCRHKILPNCNVV